MSAMKNANGDLTAIQHMISSCSGAMLTSLFVTPLDVVKIRLQAQRKPEMFTKGHCFCFSNGLMDVTYPCLNGNTQFKENCPHPEHQTKARLFKLQNSGSSILQEQFFKKPGNFTGTWDAFIQITRNEGLASLWSGLPPTLVMAVPATVIYFTLYDKLREHLQYSSHSFRDNWWKPVVAGGSARVIAATIISPLELIRTKMQSEKMTYRKVFQAAKITTQQDGILSLWRGLGPTLLRDVPFSCSKTLFIMKQLHGIEMQDCVGMALYWLGYEVVKGIVLEERGESRLRFAESFFAGAISGSIAAFLTLPFDVIKTHRQIELGEKMFFKGDKQITSTWKLIQNLYRQEGITVLFSGLTPRLVKVAPACAIMISTYEFCKAFFREKNLEKAELHNNR